MLKASGHHGQLSDGWELRSAVGAVVEAEGGYDCIIKRLSASLNRHVTNRPANRLDRPLNAKHGFKRNCPMQIWVDADACPVEIKEPLYRTAERLKIKLTLVANQSMRVPRSEFIETLLVAEGANIADRRIAVPRPAF